MFEYNPEHDMPQIVFLIGESLADHPKLEDLQAR